MKSARGPSVTGASETASLVLQRCNDCPERHTRDVCKAAFLFALKLASPSQHFVAQERVSDAGKNASTLIGESPCLE
jgi:hypothetical protein